DPSPAAVTGPDGTVYAINRAVLSAAGRRPKVGIGNASTAEGDNAVFSVTLNFASTEVVTVDYATADGSAFAGSDYVATGGSLVFAPGETAKTVSVQVNADTLIEGDEAFFIDLSNPVNATIAGARSQGRGTIIDNSTLPALSIDDVSVVEGDSGTRNAVFTVTLSPSSQQTVTVAFATADGTATVASGDYQGASGTLTFSPGDTTKTITVVVNGETLNEVDETFVVNLSDTVNATITTTQGVGTPLNDDALPTLSLDH